MCSSYHPRLVIYFQHGKSLNALLVLENVRVYGIRITHHSQLLFYFHRWNKRTKMESQPYFIRTVHMTLSSTPFQIYQHFSFVRHLPCFPTPISLSLALSGSLSHSRSRGFYLLRCSRSQPLYTLEYHFSCHRIIFDTS